MIADHDEVLKIAPKTPGRSTAAASPAGTKAGTADAAIAIVIESNLAGRAKKEGSS